MDKSYDAICIGSGLGGLVAGALASQEGKRVLVLEKHSDFGGAVNTFRRKGYELEIGLHGTDGLDVDDPKWRLIDQLKLTENVDFVKATDELFTVRHPHLGSDFVLPADSTGAIQATIERFPHHEEGIREFFGLVMKIRSKISLLSKKQGDVLFWLLNAPIAVFRFWLLGKMERVTVSSYLQQLFGDDEAVKFALCANLGYYSDDPDNFSITYFAVGQGSFLTNGCHYIRGGSGGLTRALVNIVNAGEGQVLGKRRVDRILVEKGRAVGVVHVDAASGGDEQQALGGAIFGNAAPALLGEMLPEEERPRFLEKHQDRPLSPSLWTVHMVLDQPLSNFGGTGFSTFIYPEWHQRFGQMIDNHSLMAKPPGERIPMYVVVDYGSIDSGLGDDSQHMVTMCGFDRPDNWEALDENSYKERKAQWMDALIGDLDSQFPGVAQHVVFSEMATGRTMKRFINNPGGAVYGYSQERLSSGRFRPNAVTSVKGLFLASSFALPGGGVTGAMLAGQNAHRFARKKGCL